MTMKPVKKISVLLFVILIQKIPHIVGQECLSYPSELIGSCVPINECPYLNNYLTAAQAGQPEAIQILRRSVCNGGSGRLNVCCPLNIITHSTSNSRNQGGLPERCGGEVFMESIVGGENAQLASWPWMALLRASGGNTDAWICGGVLISARYVLTAAHCVVHDVYTIKFVRLGELVLNLNHDGMVGNKRAPEPQDISVQQVIPHPQYKSPCRRCNDIALLKLASPARLDNLFVEPICLSGILSRDVGISPNQFTNIRAWVAGWGTSTEKPFVFSQTNQLQQLSVPIQNLPFCLDRKRNYPDPNMIICAGGEDKKDTCRGDSGGPLMVASQDNTWFVIGIVSFGNTICGAPGSQTVFSNVSYYLPWIQENLKP